MSRFGDVRLTNARALYALTEYGKQELDDG